MQEDERDRVMSQRLSRIVVVSGMALLRSALVRVLDLQERLTVVADLGCGEKAVTAAARSAADVVVVDVDGSCEDCLATVFGLREKVPRCRLVVLMDTGVRSAVRRVVETGVCGLVDRSASVTHVVAAVERVAAGELVLDESLAVAAATATESPLTPREAEVLRAAAAGLNGLEIARKLALAPGTVRNYLSNAMAKTGTHTRIEAIRIAADAGWLSSA